MNIPNKALIAAASLMLAGTALAHEPRHDHGRDRGGPGVTLPVVEHLGKALRRLELSGDQFEAVRAEFRGLRENIRPLMEEFHLGRRNLQTLIAAVPYDANAVAELAAAQGDLTARMTVIAGETAAAVLAQLTDEQRAELLAMGEERRARREAHRQLKHERRPARPEAG